MAASDFPGSPLILKGALVVFGAPVPVPTNLIVFQYNPDSMSRSYRQSAPTGEEAERRRSGGTRRARPPVESFSISVEMIFARSSLLIVRPFTFRHSFCGL